jgi:hypothetical protein
VRVGTLQQRAPSAIGQRNKAVGNDRGRALTDVERMRSHRESLQQEQGLQRG